MTSIKIMYLPIGVPTFHMPSAQAMFDQSKAILHKMTDELIAPDEMLLSIPLLESFIKDKTADLVIVQNVTFANSAYMTTILKHTEAPILHWTLREPVIDGGRLRLNSLTGAFSAGYAYKAMRDDQMFTLIGAPDEDLVQKTLQTLISAIVMKKKLRGMNLLVIGHTPEGFGFGRALDLDIASAFGVNLKTIEAREFMQEAHKLSEEAILKEKELAESKMIGLKEIDSVNQRDFVKLFKAYQDYIDKNNIHAIASRCWPDFFTEYKTPVCGVLGLLNDRKIAAACEADAYGALSMYVGQELSNTPTYLGDPVSINEEENTITFWHCGTAACSLARLDTGATTGVHPNRKIGPTMEFGLKAQKDATLFRIGRRPDGTFRFFIASGEILDKPQQFLGTSVVVKVEQDVHPLIEDLIQDGWEPHFVVIYGDIKEELSVLGQLLKIDTYIY
ncbi:MAG: fucose isomerase [Acholeplasma sp.]|jgi:L-fucose isomerase-like protein|nr:MAG: fucose isomerase [Acholeplasma sp.]